MKMRAAARWVCGNAGAGSKTRSTSATTSLRVNLDVCTVLFSILLVCCACAGINWRKYGALQFVECFLPPANEVWGKVIFLHLSVILFTGGLPQCMLGYHQPPHPQDHALPRTRHPPGPGTPWTMQPLGTRQPLLGPCTPSRTMHPPGPCTPQSRACWEIWSTSGRYASYWNAILFNRDVIASNISNHPQLSLRILTIPLFLSASNLTGQVKDFLFFLVVFNTQCLFTFFRFGSERRIG